MKLRGYQIQQHLKETQTPKGTFVNGEIVDNFDPTTTKKERKQRKKALEREKMLEMLKEKE